MQSGVIVTIRARWTNLNENLRGSPLTNVSYPVLGLSLLRDTFGSLYIRHAF